MMMNAYTLLTFFLLLLFHAKAEAQTILFEDDAFKLLLLEHQPVIDVNQDQEISISEAEDVTELNITLSNNSSIVESFEGIQFFVNLENLVIQNLSLNINDFSIFPKLKRLKLRYNEIDQIVIDQNLELIELTSRFNSLTQIDLANNTKLEKLSIENSLISEIELANNTELKYLNLNGSNISEIDINGLTQLDTLITNFTGIEEIDLSANVNLKTLWTFGNCLESIDISNNINLVNLDCRYNCLSNIDLKNNNNLVSLSCGGNNLEEIDIKNLENLTELSLSDNQISAIDLCNNVGLEKLYASQNQITHIDFSSTPSIDYIDLTNNLLETIILKNTNFEYRVGPFPNPNIEGNQPTFRNICADPEDSIKVKAFLSGIDSFNEYQFEYTSDCPEACINTGSNTIPLTLSPNPTDNIFTVNSASIISKVELFDINGQIVSSYSFNDTGSFTINVNNIERGIYIVKASNNNSFSTSKIIIK